MMGFLKEIFGYASDSTIIIYGSLGVILVTVAAHFILKKYSRFIKYIPGTMILLIGLINLYRILDSLVETESLDELMTVIILIVSGFVGIFAALILGVYDKPKKKIRKKKKQREEKEVQEEEQEKQKA